MTVDVIAPLGVSEEDPASHVDVAPEVYRAEVATALDAGWRFAGLHVAPGRAAVRTLLARPQGDTRLVSVPVRAGRVPSIVDIAPAAGWDEREGHDLSGVGFDGHDPLRPLAEHGPLRDWTVPVHGRDAYQIAVGPIHAGVIESGHFRFHVVGDRILHLDARLFYKHRGLERAAEGQSLTAGLQYAARACGACAVSNTLAYTHACEQALGLRADADLARVRTVLLELERVWSHLNDIAAICAGVGLAAGNNRFAALTEQARRLNATICGHRFLFGTVAIGGSPLALSAATATTARTQLAALHQDARRGWRELVFNTSFQDRLPGVGTVTIAQARRLGTVGPAARAAGLAEDVRTGCPRLSYPGFRAVVPEQAAGDVRARFEQRALELWQSFTILDRLLEGALPGGKAQPAEVPLPIGVGRVESPRGATTCVVEHVDGRLRRLRLRTGSYANWPSVAYAATGNLLPDFPLINKSFELCYACADR